jgi:hypothetical protein
MDLGRVVGVNWESHTVDLTMMLDGRPMCGVRVMSSSASTNTGLNDLCTPDLPVGLSPGQQFDLGGNTGTRDIIACVDYFGNLPVVMGFLFPQVSQMLFADKDRKIDRHSSDVYTSIDKDGNFEFHHPSGAFVRVGVTSAHEDLTGKDFDARWAITRNTDKQVHIHVEQAGGNAYVDIAPDGTTYVKSTPGFTFDGPVHFKNDITADGKVTATGDIASGGNVKDSTGKSLANARTVFNAHTHTSASPGSPTSAPLGTPM